MRWALAVLLTGCATVPSSATPLDACTLENETACVAYGAQVAGAPSAPSGQLAIGLADRAVALPDEDAVDYWRRIEEVVSAAADPAEVVCRRAAPAYARLAGLGVDAVVVKAASIEDALSQGQVALERVRVLGEFAVRWGDADAQARAARAIADAYAQQATNFAAFEVPAGLTIPAQASLKGKRDAIVLEFEKERDQLLAAVREHCRRHSLTITACE